MLVGVSGGGLVGTLVGLLCVLCEREAYERQLLMNPWSPGTGERNGGYATFVWQEGAQTRPPPPHTHTHTQKKKNTDAFPQTTLLVLSKLRLIASSARHLLLTEKQRTPHLGPPHLELPDGHWAHLMLLGFKLGRGQTPFASPKRPTEIHHNSGVSAETPEL